MAKLVTTINGDFDRFRSYLEEAILNGSHSASLEDIQETMVGNTRCCVMVFERYSYMGGNRVSMNVTLLSAGGSIQIIAVTAGGSQAMFYKINTIGEESFLKKCQDAIDAYAEC